MFVYMLCVFEAEGDKAIDSKCLKVSEEQEPEVLLFIGPIVRWLLFASCSSRAVFR